MLNLYLLNRKTYTEYDEYDKAIVVAKTENEAKKIYPGDENQRNIGIPNFKWVAEKKVNAVFIGIAADHLKEGDVVLASLK